VVDLLVLALPLFIFFAIILSLGRPPPKNEYKNYIRVGRKWMTMDEYRRRSGGASSQGGKTG